jgi:hypothetical protein
MTPTIAAVNKQSEEHGRGWNFVHFVVHHTATISGEACEVSGGRPGSLTLRPQRGD